MCLYRFPSLRAGKNETREMAAKHMKTRKFSLGSRCVFSWPRQVPRFASHWVYPCLDSSSNITLTRLFARAAEINHLLNVNLGQALLTAMRVSDGALVRARVLVRGVCDSETRANNITVRVLQDVLRHLPEEIVWNISEQSSGIFYIQEYQNVSLSASSIRHFRNEKKLGVSPISQSS